MSKKSSNFAGVIENKVNTMARPIKETPTLYGEDARKGEKQIQKQNPVYGRQNS